MTVDSVRYVSFPKFNVESDGTKKRPRLKKKIKKKLDIIHSEEKTSVTTLLSKITKKIAALIFSFITTFLYAEYVPGSFNFR